MRFKLITLLAALMMVSACASESETVAISGGDSSTQSTSSSTTSSSSGSSSVSEAMVSAGSAAEFVNEIGDRVYFAFDSSELSSAAQLTLSRQAQWLQQYPGAYVRIEGYCDERGTREYNLALGERRANAVREYLVSRGVAANRVGTISYGKERPAVMGSNEAAWAQNRRAVTDVVGGVPSS